MVTFSSWEREAAKRRILIEGIPAAKENDSSLAIKKTFNSGDPEKEKDLSPIASREGGIHERRSAFAMSKLEPRREKGVKKKVSRPFYWGGGKEREILVALEREKGAIGSQRNAAWPISKREKGKKTVAHYVSVRGGKRGGKVYFPKTLDQRREKGQHLARAGVSQSPLSIFHCSASRESNNNKGKK